MEIYILYRVEEFEGSETLAVCATLDRAKAEAAKEHVRLYEHRLPLGEWHTLADDPFKRVVADIDDTGSYMIEHMQVLP